MTDNNEITLPLQDIDSIDVIKMDKKKVIIGTSIFAVLSAIGIVYAHGLASLLAED